MSDITLPAGGSAARPGLWTRLGRMRALHHQRQALARLDDHILRDVGLTRDEAEREARRAAWDSPSWWR